MRSSQSYGSSGGLTTSSAEECDSFNSTIWQLQSGVTVGLQMALSRTEYIALFGSLVLIFLEGLIHIITFCLRKLDDLNHSAPNSIGDNRIRGWTGLCD